MNRLRIYLSNQETQVGLLGQEDPLKEEIPPPVFLPGESHVQRSLVGCSPWGHRVKLDLVTEHAHTQHYHWSN